MNNAIPPAGPTPFDDLVQQLLLRADVRVERSLEQAQLVAEVLHRGSVVAALREETGGGLDELGSARAGAADTAGRGGDGTRCGLGHSNPRLLDYGLSKQTIVCPP